MYLVNVQAPAELPTMAIPANCADITDGGTPPALSFKLRVLDIRDPNLKEVRSTTISVPGVDPLKQAQRPALLRVGARIVVAFGSYTDTGPFHGVVASFRESDLALMSSFTTAAAGNVVSCPRVPTGGGGIWMSGQGPAADESGNIFTASGNGKFDGTSNFSDSIIKLSPSLTRITHFTPFNQRLLTFDDQDLGSGGVLLIPNTNIAVAGGKEGVMYLLDRTRAASSGGLGGYIGPSPSSLDGPCNIKPGVPTGQDSNALQTFQASEHTCNGFVANIHGTPVFWNGASGPALYLWAEQDRVKRFPLVNNRVPTDPIAGLQYHAGTFQIGRPSSKSTVVSACGMPGGFLSLSANGNAAGILWGTMSTEDAVSQVREGVLFAFDANDVSRILWSTQTGSDSLSAGLPGGKFPKFNPPTIANGKVYLPTFAPSSSSAVGDRNLIFSPGNRKTKVVVYGLRGK
jgi:hypothetical protein